MSYQKTVYLSGDPAKALNTVRNILMQHNFRITPISHNEFEITGPGMNSNQVNPLLAISHARITLSGHTLGIEAELGAVSRFGRIMAIFLILLAVFMVGVFSFLYWSGLLHPRGGSNPIKGPILILLVLLPFAPWPFLLPFMIGSFREKAIRAIDTLLENAAL